MTERNPAATNAALIADVIPRSCKPIYVAATLNTREVACHNAVLFTDLLRGKIKVVAMSINHQGVQAYGKTAQSPFPR